MKYLKQLLIILAFCFVGEILNNVLPFPIPASIYGIVLMFLALQFKVVKLESVNETSKFLIEIMPVMFIPAAAGLINSWSLISSSWLPYLVITLSTTIFVMVVSGYVTQIFAKKEEK